MPALARVSNVLHCIHILRLFSEAAKTKRKKNIVKRILPWCDLLHYVFWHIHIVQVSFWVEHTKNLGFNVTISASEFVSYEFHSSPCRCFYATTHTHIFFSLWASIVLNTTFLFFLLFAQAFNTKLYWWKLHVMDVLFINWHKLLYCESEASIYTQEYRIEREHLLHIHTLTKPDFFPSPLSILDTFFSRYNKFWKKKSTQKPNKWTMKLKQNAVWTCVCSYERERGGNIVGTTERVRERDSGKICKTCAKGMK